MLHITVPGELALYNEETQQLITQGDVDLVLEHSLASVSKWESIFEKPFLTEGDKSSEEVSAYIEAMILTPNFPPGIVSRMSKDNLDKIDAHINAKMTASWVVEQGSSKTGEQLTSELIYYWMVSMNIPWEAQHWHLNRLLMLIKICSVKNAPPKKLSAAEVAAQRRELNARRRQASGSTG